MRFVKGLAGLGLVLGLSCVAANAAAQGEASDDTARRAAILAPRTYEVVLDQDVSPVGPVLFGVFGGGCLALAYFDDDTDPMATAAASLALATGVSFFVLPETHRNDGLTFGFLMALAPLVDGNATSAERDASAFGLFSMLAALPLFVSPNPVAEYRSDLGTLRVAVTGAPVGAGLGLSGTF